MSQSAVEGEENDFKDSPFSDAVYKELSRINGRINQMSKPAIASKLKSLKLSSDGNCEVLKKRLKNYYKNQKLTSANLLSVANLLPYYVIVDFEATCEEVNGPGYPHEIIEFPAVLVDTEKQKIVDHFQAYCKPEENPILSEFCKELTGISQEMVDAAEPFPNVLKEFEAWLHKHRLGSKHKFAVVTDGPWDMGRFLYGQCKMSGIEYPAFANKWINIRKVFSNFYKSKRFCLKSMLDHLQLDFEGRPHCGLDDARNIAQILLRLIADGASLQVNERIQTRESKPNCQTERIVEPVQYKNPSPTYVKVHRERSQRESKLARINNRSESKEKEEKPEQ